MLNIKFNNKEELINSLKRITVANSISGAVLTFKDDKLIFKGMFDLPSCYVDYKKKLDFKITQEDKYNMMIVDDVNLLIKFISSVKEKSITLVFNGDSIRIANSRKNASLRASTADNIKSYINIGSTKFDRKELTYKTRAFGELKFKRSIKISNEVISEIMSDSSLLGITKYELTFIPKENKLKVLINNDENKIETIYDVNMPEFKGKDEFTLVFADEFAKAITQLSAETGEVTLYFNATDGSHILAYAQNMYIFVPHYEIEDEF